MQVLLLLLLLRCLLCSVLIFDSEVQAFGRTTTTTATTTTKKTKCLNPPRTARRVELFIKECQEEVRNKLAAEAFQILKDQLGAAHPYSEQEDAIVDLDELHEADAHRWPLVIFEADAEPRPRQQHTNYYEYSSHEEPPTRGVARMRHQMRRRADAATTTTTSEIYHPTLLPYEDKRIAGCLLHCVYAKNNAIDKLGWPTLDGLVEFYSEGVSEHGFFMAALRSVNLCLRAATHKYRVNRRQPPHQGESCDLAFDVFDCISDQITGYCLDHYKK